MRLGPIAAYVALTSLTATAGCGGVAGTTRARAPSAPAVARGDARPFAAPVVPAAAPRQPDVPTARLRTIAYATIGDVLVATVYRVARATPVQGPVTVVRFDPAYTRLVLHAGSAEPTPGLQWRHGASVHGAERAVLLAAFNGGFKMRDARGGWVSEGRTVVRLVAGAASVVIYADGGVDVGAWGRDVPAPARRVLSVRQNLELLVNAGRAQLVHPPDQATLDRWWGHAFLEQPLISRSAVGVTADHAVVWAAGSDITVAALAHALIDAGVVRAMELDINAPLVRGFLFPGAATVHLRNTVGSATVPLVAGQRELRHDPGLRDPAIAPHCTYLVPCTRDFFTVTVVPPSARHWR